MSRPLDIADLWRWAVCAVLVAVAHAAAAAIIVNSVDPIAPGAPSAAIVVDLAPIAAAPEEAQPDVAPGPLSQPVDAPPEIKPDDTAADTPVDQVAAQETVATEREDTPVETATEPVDAPEEKPVARVEPEPPQQAVASPPEPMPQDQPLVEAAPRAEKPDVTAAVPVKPAAAPPPPPKTRKVRRPMQLATAPPPAPQRDTRPTAPAPGLPSRSSRQAALTWNSAISAALERAKRYPPEAKSRGEHGTAVVAFSIDRSGRVLSSRIARSSGSPVLDRETLATLARADLPAAPAEHPGARFSFSVPIRFNIR